MITNEELNPIEIWKNKESELIRKGFEPVLDRTKDSYFKYLMDGKVLETFAKTLTSMFFGKVNSVSMKLDGEFKVAYNKRDFELDVVCQVDDIFFGVEMERNNYLVLERFFIYWGVLATNRKKGEPTQKLTTRKCLQVVISKNSIKNQNHWLECWRTYSDLSDKASDFGINVVVIDLKNFQKLVQKPTPGNFLENFIAFLISEKISDTIQLYKADQCGILKDVVNRDVSFLAKRNYWNKYMKESKSVVAAYENGKEDGKKEIEAKLHEMEAQLKVKEKALKQAEAKIAKLESEAEAKNKA